MKLPDFIIAGFSKCGSTGLLVNLAQHPSVGIGALPDGSSREMHFFDRDANWRRGLDWYRARFPDVPVAGEKTPAYVRDARVMQRIAKALPEVKIVICLRNPVDRLYSWYQHKILRWRPKAAAQWPMRRFREFHELEAYDPALTSCYDQVLEKNLLPFFPRERIRFVIQERLHARGWDEVNEVLAFLGLGPASGSLLYPNASAYQSALAEEDRARLLEFYAAHVERTFGLLGERITEWQR